MWTLKIHNIDLKCSLRLVLPMDRAGILFLFLSEKIHHKLTDIFNSNLASHLNSDLKNLHLFSLLLKILVSTYINKYHLHYQSI